MKTALAIRGTAIERAEIAGTLQALPGADVKLAPLGAGRLVELRVGEGDPVRKGELLARIDPASLRAQVDAARAQLEQARAQELNGTQHERRAAQALDAGVAPRQELEDAQAALASARAQVRSAQSALTTAENQLERSELRAPFDGLVAHLFAAQGETIDASRPVLEVAQTAQLELRGAAPAGIAARLRPGLPGAILAAGIKSDARVLAVAPVIDPATGAAAVRLRVENGEGALKIGEVARAQIALASHENALLIPQAALLPAADDADDHDDGDAGAKDADDSDDSSSAGTVCIVDTQSKARCIRVRARAAQEGQVEILRSAPAIEPGARVILQGAYSLPDGTPVRAGPAPADATSR